MGANDERRDVNSIRQDRGSRFDNHYVSRVGHLSIYNLCRDAIRRAVLSI
jgi:hypothetical protein